MARSFHKACVIGAGVMGQGIAAHLANARVPVLLLDIVPPSLSDEDKKAGLDPASKAFRNRFAQGGLDKALQAKPALFFTKKAAELVEVGNLEDDLEKVRECDLVIEVVLEKLEVKQQLFARLEKVIAPGTVVSSNTSGLSIAGTISRPTMTLTTTILTIDFPASISDWEENSRRKPAIGLMFWRFGAIFLGV